MQSASSPMGVRKAVRLSARSTALVEDAESRRFRMKHANKTSKLGNLQLYNMFMYYDRA